MTPQGIAYLLAAHSVPHFIAHGHIIADSMECGTALFERTIDMTGWSRARVYAWLGY